MIQNDILYLPYDCDGVVEEFNITPLEYLKTAENIAVYYTVIATGAEYPLVKDTNYTVDTVADTITTITGDITGLGSTSSPYASGIKLTIKLDAPYTQLTDITSNANYDPENLEQTYDKNTILTKQNKDGVDRSVKLQESDVGISMIMPPIDDLKGGVLGFHITTGEPEVHPGFIPRQYDAGYTYSTNDIIQADGLFYIALQSTLGNDPVVGAYWGLYNLQNINAWDNGTTYALDAVVSYLGDLYISLQASNIGNTPSSSPAYWEYWQNADKVNITDSGGYFTGTEVETALQEVGPVVGNVDQDVKTSSSPTFNGIQTDNIVLKTKVIEIGDWDMDTDITAIVTHNLNNYKNIRSLNVTVRDDADTLYSSLTESPHTSGGATISVRRAATGSMFDNVNYNATGFNRGWVTITAEV
ncbi:MAG: hypothetical protein E3J23_08720 [Candidatus Stahlbacteria bacterium]|nr:MAG: hypothetical protein E3J23_08720 [Candidatus Stahlbacteria bacterium]